MSFPRCFETWCCERSSDRWCLWQSTHHVCANASRNGPKNLRSGDTDQGPVQRQTSTRCFLLRARTRKEAASRKDTIGKIEHQWFESLIDKPDCRDQRRLIADLNPCRLRQPWVYRRQFMQGEIDRFARHASTMSLRQPIWFRAASSYMPCSTASLMTRVL